QTGHKALRGGRTLSPGLRGRVPLPRGNGASGANRTMGSTITCWDARLDNDEAAANAPRERTVNGERSARSSASTDRSPDSPGSSRLLHLRPASSSHTGDHGSHGTGEPGLLAVLPAAVRRGRPLLPADRPAGPRRAR